MICVRDFCAGYDGRVVLRADALDLREGRVCGLLGRNGSGKSTLLKAVCALGPYQGSVLVDGNEVSDLQRIERARRVAYLPQSLAVPQMSVRTLVSHGRFARMSASKVLGDQDRLRVEEAMRSVGVDGMAGRELPELSGGERQLAYLAMVVAQDAPMLLLDEPGTYLDLAHQVELARLLRKLAAGGRGVVMATHDVASAFSTCDELVLVGDGKVVATGTPSELSAKPDLLRACLGVTVARTDVPGAVYGYVPCK
jgi:iron complex transport system ATP-binding protein